MPDNPMSLIRNARNRVSRREMAADSAHPGPWLTPIANHDKWTRNSGVPIVNSQGLIICRVPNRLSETRDVSTAHFIADLPANITGANIDVCVLCDALARLQEEKETMLKELNRLRGFAALHMCLVPRATNA